MNTFAASSSLGVSADALFEWHRRPGAFERLTPPWAPVRLEQFEGIAEGDRAVLRVGPPPLTLQWVAEHHDVVEGRQFCDRQVQGPFSHWDHTHRFEPDADDTERATLTDRVEYELPGGALGQRAAPWLEAELRRQFAYRHRITRRDLSLHQRCPPDAQSLTIAVSGTSGLVGSNLVPFLTTGGHTVKRLTRSGPTGADEILWDPRTDRVEADKLEGVDAVVHLAGENVFGRWTPAKKQRIYSSRADGTRLLAETLAGLDDPPEVLVSSSAVGYYGDHGPDRITEASAPRDAGFLGEVCEAWEAAPEPAAAAGIRTVQMRTGIVLTPAGGALRLMLPAFWLGLGGRVGGRHQYFPWITLDDVLGGIYHALRTDALEGPVNLTAPSPVTMEAYTNTLADVLRRPAFLNVPSSVVRTVGGEMADEMLLTSARVVPERLQETGYDFGFSALEDGLRHVLGRTDA
ncbi:TIGR01777 family oxidoreductase [Salinibacter altiplanensis]|uniref:TIGR01777 family oxidoreductase n=1 Tax=Salinibacter altiplanensis TaxID=1803181 RepID=UPI000C9FC9EC|nr:TIGR01777 family oxidoreductase [Salinibacter altiplanensis]